MHTSVHDALQLAQLKLACALAAVTRIYAPLFFLVPSCQIHPHHVTFDVR